MRCYRGKFAQPTLSPHTIEEPRSKNDRFRYCSHEKFAVRFSGCRFRFVLLTRTRTNLILRNSFLFLFVARALECQGASKREHTYTQKHGTREKIVNCEK